MSLNSKQAITGPGRFQWNSGAWFGSSLGCSSWMVPTAILLLYFEQPLLALMPLCGFASILVLVCFLWSKRDRILPFSAHMTQLTFVACIFPIVWFSIQSHISIEAREFARLPQTTWLNALYIITIVPIFMITFSLLEKRGLKQREVIQAPLSK